MSEEASNAALLDKLGIDSQSIVAMSGLVTVDEDGSIQRDIIARAKHAKDGTIEPDSTIIFMRVGHVLELSALKRLQKSMRPDAAVWAIWQKDKPNLQESDIRKGAEDAGMSGGEVIDFSEAYSALKLTIPGGAS